MRTLFSSSRPQCDNSKNVYAKNWLFPSNGNGWSFKAKFSKMIPNYPIVVRRDQTLCFLSSMGVIVDIQNKTVHFVERAEPIPPPTPTNSTGATATPSGFGGATDGGMDQAMMDEVNETTSIFINAFPGAANLQPNDIQVRSSGGRSIPNLSFSRHVESGAESLERFGWCGSTSPCEHYHGSKRDRHEVWTIAWSISVCLVGWTWCWYQHWFWWRQSSFRAARNQRTVSFDGTHAHATETTHRSSRSKRNSMDIFRNTMAFF